MIWRRMKRQLRRLVRTATGRDVVPYSPAFSSEARLKAILRWMDADTVLDVGAGHGEFGAGILENGFAGRLISVEPCPRAYEELTSAARKHQRWTVTERCAAGREDGESVLHVSRRSGSSSLRQPGARHVQTDKDSVEIGHETVLVRRLDGLVSDMIGPAARVFLKIDVQGTEDDVLEGSLGLMSRVQGMQVELSVVELYGGQKLMPEMLSWAARHEFSLWGLEPVYVDEKTGRTLQYDGIFVADALRSPEAMRL